MLRHLGAFEAALAAVGEAARRRRLVVVPGGGPFADAVRDADRRFGLSDDAAHWMAVLAMDQYAHVLAGRLPNAALVAGPDEARAALAAGACPVLAPYAWLRAADPLPHAWAVTSDSIAAWVAGALGARRLVLVKPPGVSAATPRVVDDYFARAIPPGLPWAVVAADDAAGLSGALGGRRDGRA